MTRNHHGAAEAPQQLKARSRRELNLRIADLERQRSAIGSQISEVHARLAELEDDVPLASELLTLEEAGVIAGVTPRVLWSEAKKKRLEIVGGRGKRRVHRAELMRWMTLPARQSPPANANGAPMDDRADARAAVERTAALTAMRLR